jgi:hypothetical protein
MRDFARAGKIMTSLGIVHSKLAEMKCCEKGIKVAVKAEDFKKKADQSAGDACVTQR